LTNRCTRRGAVALMLIATGLSWDAHASGIAGAVIAPHEYDLPLDFAPIGEFVEYGYANDDDRRYALNGAAAAGPGGETFEGLSKLAYLAPLGEHLGYELEALVPLVAFAGRDPSRLGLGVKTDRSHDPRSRRAHSARLGRSRLHST
jgi:hypothetical protein